MSDDKVSQQQEINEVFVLMADAIRAHGYEYGAHDMLFMVADLIPHNPVLAAAIANHAGDFIESEACNHKTEWTDIVIEAYRRAFFDVEQSPKYGTGWLIDNIPAMRQFVNDYIRNHALSDVGVEAPTSVQ